MIRASMPPAYTDVMSIVRNIAGIAKGMSITFGEMLQPTQVENYPDGPGPLRGAKFEQRYRGAHVLRSEQERSLRGGGGGGVQGGAHLDDRASVQPDRVLWFVPAGVIGVRGVRHVR